MLLSAGDSAALEQLKEEKEFAEGQVRAPPPFSQGHFINLSDLPEFTASSSVSLGQINFLNSVIVDLQRKNEELKIKLKKLALAEFNGNDGADG